MVILGAGEAGSAIAISMLNHGAMEVSIHDIEPDLADKLVKRLATGGEMALVPGRGR